MDSPTLFTLANGMRFIVAPNSALPAAAVGLWTDVGVCDEPEERRGIAHFLEHMMFRGSRNVGPEEHAHLIARLGGDCNAFTSPDATVYHQTVPAAAVGEVFRLEADRFQQLELKNEHLEVERKVILEELRVRENQPISRALTQIRELISGDHPYALDPLGRRAALEEMEVADLEEFYRRCYRPDRTVAVICGAVKLDHIQDLALRYFDNWRAPQGDLPRSQPPVYTPHSGSISCPLPLEIPIAARIYRTLPLAEIDKPALDLLVALLSSGISSPIREALVRKRRLCVEAGCVNMIGAHGGLLICFGAFLPPGRHAPRQAILKDLAEDLATQGPDPEQFGHHLKRFRKHRAQDGYSCQQQMMGLGSAELLEGGFEKYTHGLEVLAAVTPERIQAMARDLLQPQHTLELDITPENTPWWMLPVGLFTRLWPR